MKAKAIILISIFIFSTGNVFALDDSAALSGVMQANAIYDVRTAEEKKLQFIFKVISDTLMQTRAQNVDAKYVASMRGPTVKLLVKGRAGDAKLQEKTVELINKLTNQGVRLEACGYALDLFAVEPEDLYDGVVAVGNSLNSLIGYQAKGYALVPMN